MDLTLEIWICGALTYDLPTVEKSKHFFIYIEKERRFKFENSPF